MFYKYRKNKYFEDGDMTQRLRFVVVSLEHSEPNALESFVKRLGLFVFINILNNIYNNYCWRIKIRRKLQWYRIGLNHLSKFCFLEGTYMFYQWNRFIKAGFIARTRFVIQTRAQYIRSCSLLTVVFFGDLMRF